MQIRSLWFPLIKTGYCGYFKYPQGVITWSFDKVVCSFLVKREKPFRVVTLYFSISFLKAKNLSVIVALKGGNTKLRPNLDHEYCNIVKVGRIGGDLRG